MKDATYVILNWEQDYDDTYKYFMVTVDGMLVTYNIITEEVTEYDMNEVLVK